MTRKYYFGPMWLAGFATVFCGATLVQAAADDAALTEVRGKMSAMFESIDPENITYSPVDGWFTIQQGSVIAYVSDDGRYLLQGDLIDLEQQVNLSEQSRNNARRELIAALTDDEAILFSPADVKYSVTVFTDVECSYCRKLHSQIDEYLAKGIQVRYALYPRNGPASKSWSTSEKVWCAKDRNQALTAAKLDQEFETSQCDSAMVSNHYRVGRDVGLSGTPAIVLEDGTLIGGYLPPAQLSLQLQQHVPQP
ncbi:MAG: thioredoxin fold domain-containing protein [Gammaproteobacteria bacterium]|nr:thioredoxin fold domain-containing protein [Gammaproteobacteria bacterium]MDH3480781.1 thioredoxin fold domain-containing protein [Gammaproteobacteria bacterium]